MLKKIFLSSYYKNNIRKILLMFFTSLFIRILINYIAGINLEIYDFTYIYYLFIPFFSYMPYCINFSYKNLLTFLTNETNNLNNNTPKINLLYKCKRKIYWILVENRNKSPLDSWESSKYDQFVKNWDPKTKLFKTLITNELNKYKCRMKTLKWIFGRRNSK
jgi:hypothetical protein